VDEDRLTGTAKNLGGQTEHAYGRATDATVSKRGRVVAIREPRDVGQDARLIHYVVLPLIQTIWRSAAAGEPSGAQHPSGCQSGGRRTFLPPRWLPVGVQSLADYTVLVIGTRHKVQLAEEHASITRAFAWTVLSPTSNAAHRSAVVMHGVIDLSPRK
jgi:hypothetical protein